MVIKPDVVQEGRVEEIVKLLQSHGVDVLAREQYQLSRKEAEEFYQEHKDQVPPQTLHWCSVFLSKYSSSIPNIASL